DVFWEQAPDWRVIPLDEQRSHGLIATGKRDELALAVLHDSHLNGATRGKRLSDLDDNLRWNKCGQLLVTVKLLPVNAAGRHAVPVGCRQRKRVLTHLELHTGDHRGDVVL